MLINLMLIPKVKLNNFIVLAGWSSCQIQATDQYHITNGRAKANRRDSFKSHWIL